VYEIFKRLLQQRDEEHALQAVAAIQQGRVIDLDSTLTISAAKLSAESGLPMADSIILATARAHEAIV
jgi:predicted nucleic acid-binding protein